MTRKERKKAANNRQEMSTLKRRKDSYIKDKNDKKE